MVKLLGDNFRFVSIIPTPIEFLQGGYPSYENVPYNICTYRSEIEREKALKLGLSSDVVIFGASNRKFLKERIKHEKLIFIYSERLFKKNNWIKFNPRVVRYMLRYHTKYRAKNIHLLCSSGFLPNDMNWFFAYPGKKYKWGYFTKFDSFAIEDSLKIKSAEKKIKILWVARFIKLKHPMLVIKLANFLKRKGYSFEITMIGTGERFELIKQKISKFNLEDYVILKGNIVNEEVLIEMRKSHIFLMTSDRREGWGAVMNEALSNGCAVIASSDIGSSPYLIKPGVNGLIFKSKSIKSLIEKVETLLLNPMMKEQIALKAYESMTEIWSPNNAAKNIIQLGRDIINKKPNSIKSGPCSPAEKTKQKWHLINKH